MLLDIYGCSNNNLITGSTISQTNIVGINSNTMLESKSKSNLN